MIIGSMAIKTLKRIDPWSTAKILAVVDAIFGITIAILFNLLSLTGYNLTTYTASLLYGPVALIALPLIYGELGFVVGLATAAIYNLLAKWIGGIKLDIS